MYYYGTGGTGCPNQTTYCCPVVNQSKSNYAIVLVLFILLVIILGNRFSN